jgi:hypothetical protein
MSRLGSGAKALLPPPPAPNICSSAGANRLRTRESPPFGGPDSQPTAFHLVMEGSVPVNIAAIIRPSSVLAPVKAASTTSILSIVSSLVVNSSSIAYPLAFVKSA